MRKLFLSLVLYSMLGAGAFADDAVPPPPPSLPSGTDVAPPPVDSSLSAPPSSDSTADKSAPAADSLDTGTVAPPPPAPQVPEEAKPAPVKPTPTAKVQPTPMKEKVAPLKNMTLSTGKDHAVADTGTQGGGTLADYFPTVQGMKWTYEYRQGKKARQVECTSSKSMPNGTGRVVMEVTEGNVQFRQRYSLYDNKVEHTATADKLFKGDFTFKLPGAGESIQWSRTLPGAVVKHDKASFGTGKAGDKIYDDCLVVVEKSTKGKKAGPITISYYAKGIGLVALESYSPDMKLIPEKSYALSSSSGGN